MGEQAGLLALGGGAATASGSRSSGAAAPTVEPAEQEETRKGEGNGEPAPAKPGYDPGAKRPCPGDGAGGAADKRQRPLPQQPSDPDHEKASRGARVHVDVYVCIRIRMHTGALVSTGGPLSPRLDAARKIGAFWTWEGPGARF
eukprot:9443692-Pyramimonas_sp.AAC.1